MMVTSYGVSLTPGNELKYFWHSNSADIEGSRNYIGIKNKALDSLINEIIIAANRKDLITAVKALDRVLLHNYYLIPNWYTSVYRIAYWNKIQQPKIYPKYDLAIYSWWINKK